MIFGEVDNIFLPRQAQTMEEAVEASRTSRNRNGWLGYLILNQRDISSQIQRLCGDAFWERKRGGRGRCLKLRDTKDCFNS
jgi:hypothetical protein